MSIKPTSEKAAEYLWFGKKCLALNTYGSKAMADGLYTIICKYTPDKAVLIAIGGGNFFSHPRTGKLKDIPYFDNAMNQFAMQGIYGGGFRQTEKDGKTIYEEIENRTVYPLVDDDKGTWVISVDDPSCEWSDAEKYGNNFWIGTDGSTLSWHGVPNRHFPIDAKYLIPGLTEYENTLGSGETATAFYTCFKNNVYESGDVLATVPEKHLVAGACYQDGTLLVAAVDSSNSKYNLKLLKQGDDKTPWIQIGAAVPTSRLKTSAFFTLDGLSMTFDGVAYKVSPTEFTRVTPSTYTFSGKQQEGADKLTFTKSGKIAGLWTENGNSESLEYASSCKTTSSGSANSNKVTVPLVAAGSATYVKITGEPDGSGYFHFKTDGPYCEAIWSGDCDKEGKLNKAGASGDPCKASTGFTVTVTLKPKGLTDTYTRDPGSAPPCVMTVSGPDYPVDGSTYTASGGTGAITWAISKGSISGGVVTVSGLCGSVVITATDSCGCVASKTGMMPTGTWCSVGYVFDSMCGQPRDCFYSPCKCGCETVNIYGWWDAGPSTYLDGVGGVFMQNGHMGTTAGTCGIGAVACKIQWNWVCASELPCTPIHGVGWDCLS